MQNFPLPHCLPPPSTLEGEKKHFNQCPPLVICLNSPYTKTYQHWSTCTQFLAFTLFYPLRSGLPLPPGNCPGLGPQQPAQCQIRWPFSILIASATFYAAPLGSHGPPRPRFSLLPPGSSCSALIRSSPPNLMAECHRGLVLFTAFSVYTHLPWI